MIYREAYPGIDLKFYGQGQELEYDVVVKPGADPSQVKFAYQGIKSMEVTPGGDLALNLPDGSVLMQKKPLVYQEIAGQRVAREGKFKVQQGTAHLMSGFEIASYDPAYPLVIDPVVYATYLGGGYEDYGLAIAVNKSGEAVVTGYTQSFIGYNDFPHPYAIYLFHGKKDVFITKFKSDGSELVFSTYLGGEDDEEGRSIAIDQEGQICVTGNTYSEDFPNPGAYQSDKAGVYDAFITKLAANGGSLIFSTYLGGTQSDYGRGIAVDDSNNIYVTGNTRSNPFSSQAPLYPYGDGKDAFVCKFSPSGSLLFNTYLGGSSDDDGAAIAVSPAGQIYVTGNTYSADFRREKALYDTINAFKPDAFVTSIRADLSGLAFSTFLGGDGSDYGNAVALDTTGHVYVGGNTYSNVFPTRNALFPVNGGKADVFLTKFEPNGDALVFSTFLGGSEADNCYSIAVVGSDEVTLTGVTASDNFPLKGVVTGYPLRGDYDAFVTRFRANGQGLIFSGYLGGNGLDQGLGVALDKGGQVYVTGFTNSDNFPVKNALYPDKNLGTGNYDAFYVKIHQPSTALTFLSDLLED